MMLDMNNNALDKAVDGDPNRAGRASEVSPGPDSDVEIRAEWRRFTAQYKRSVLEHADQWQGVGEIGVLLRP